MCLSQILTQLKMTEQNMKKLYDHYVATGNTKEAKRITDIPRYAKFKEPEVEPKKETKSKKEK